MKATKRNKQTVKEDLSRRKKHQVLYTTYLKKIDLFCFYCKLIGFFQEYLGTGQKVWGGGAEQRGGGS